MAKKQVRRGIACRWLGSEGFDEGELVASTKNVSWLNPQETPYSTLVSELGIYVTIPGALL